MLAKRIIPTLLHRGDTLVKGKQFNSWRSVGHVQQAARIYAQRGVDELCILDIGATPESRGPNFPLIEKLTDGNFTPIAIGGGVKTVEDVERLLRAGADKVVIKTNALSLIDKVSRIVGCQAVVAAVDYNIINKAFATLLAREFEQLGAGEILLTSIDREGMMEGYDLEMIHAVSSAVSIPVIAHGGCGTYEHMHEALQAGADAVAAGAMFQFTDQTPKGAAEYLKTKGWVVRL